MKAFYDKSIFVLLIQISFTVVVDLLRTQKAPEIEIYISYPKTAVPFDESANSISDTFG